MLALRNLKRRKLSFQLNQQEKGQGFPVQSSPVFSWTALEGFHNRVAWGSETAADRLCVLSSFSDVQLCVSPRTAASQAPLSTGFSRPEY